MAIDKKLIDQLLTNYKKPEDIIGENGLLKELTKAILERALGPTQQQLVTDSRIAIIIKGLAGRYSRRSDHLQSL